MINGYLYRGRLYCEDCTTALGFCAAVRLRPAQTTECAECRVEVTGKDATVVLPASQENPTYGDLSAAEALFSALMTMNSIEHWAHERSTPTFSPYAHVRAALVTVCTMLIDRLTAKNVTADEVAELVEDLIGSSTTSITDTFTYWLDQGYLV